METTMDTIFAEMIERRPLLAPMSSFRPPRQSSRPLKRRVSFAADYPAPKIDTVKELAATPHTRRRIERLERRFYTPLPCPCVELTVIKGYTFRSWRLWRIKPGIYELVCFHRRYSSLDGVTYEVTLRKPASSELMRVRLPRSMTTPGYNATHLKVKKAAGDPQYPRGKAEWVVR